MVAEHLRPIAICLLSWEDKILVFEGYDAIKDEYFYRPLGGGIEFGEYSHQTVKREIMEEIGAEIQKVKYLYTLENIFICDGLRGHEIVQVYDAELVNKAIYGKILEGIEDNGEKFTALWKSVDEIEGEGRPLYPDGLKEKIGLKK